MNPLKILLATDGSTSALAAADWINDHFQPETTHVEVVTVTHVDLPLFADPSPGDSYRFMLEDAQAQTAHRAQEILTETQERLARFTPTPAVVYNQPVAGLLQYLRDHQPDLLVMGRRGHHGLPGMVLGSVSLSMVQRSPIPILVVEPAAGDAHH